MSTQRRENRWRRTNCTMRSKVLGFFLPGHDARRVSSFVSGGTAPPGYSVWLATNSLQLGYRIVKHVREELCHGSQPFRAGLGGLTDTPAIHGSPLLHTPSLSGLARLHPSLPRVPAG